MGVPTVCVVGRKNSGKTLITIQLIAELGRRGHRVMSAKHGHGFELDRPGTDSWGHRHHGGARRIALVGPDSMAVMGSWDDHGEPPLDEVVERFLSDAEVVVAEGFKTAPFPRIEVFRTDLHDTPLFEDPSPGAGRWIGVVASGPVGNAPCPVFSMDDAEVVPRLADLVEQELMLRPAGADPVGRPHGREEVE
jgi:molybdopterin-guanine dinucleotide biosynthesis protein B